MPAQTTTITVRVPTRLKRKLDRLATSTSRSASWLAMDAIDTYVALHEWQIGAIEEGIRAADADDVVGHEAVATWMSSWGRKRPSRKP